jgi:nicotinate dehydrogenase subunit A
MAVTLRVNGRKRRLEDLADDTPLLYVLRNDLGLNGVRYGCGAGQCGACFVLVDGAAVPSCVTPVASAAGAEITTVEGLGTAERPHPVQAAFIVEQAAQCGYCTAGMVASAAALLARTPNPSDNEIRAGMARNLCRCGSYDRILRAVRRAAGQAGQAGEAGQAGRV